MSTLYVYCYVCDILVGTIEGQVAETAGRESFPEHCEDCSSELEYTTEEGYESIMGWGDTSLCYWEEIESRKGGSSNDEIK